MQSLAAGIPLADCDGPLAASLIGSRDPSPDCCNIWVKTFPALEKPGLLFAQPEVGVGVDNRSIWAPCADAYEDRFVQRVVLPRNLDGELGPNDGIVVVETGPSVVVGGLVRVGSPDYRGVMEVVGRPGLDNRRSSSVARSEAQIDIAVPHLDELDAGKHLDSALNARLTRLAFGRPTPPRASRPKDTSTPDASTTGRIPGAAALGHAKKKKRSALLDVGSLRSHKSARAGSR